MRAAWLILLPLALGGCQRFGNWADNVGDHMPVVTDERCEHWQCITKSGQERSKEIQAEKEAAKKAAPAPTAPEPAAPTTPAFPDASEHHLITAAPM